MKDVRLLSAPFDPNTEIEPFARACPEAGGIATFVGKVRPGGGVEALELSHYEPLTRPGMEALADRAELLASYAVPLLRDEIGDFPLG